MPNVTVQTTLSVLGGVTMLAVAWGALAFGAVYPWAYGPLAYACALLGAVSITGLRARVPIRALAICLVAIAAAVGLQLAPVPYRTLVKVSPGADAFLAQHDFSYRLAKTGLDPSDPSAASGPPANRPLSLAPADTALGLGLFAAFAIFLLGTTRLLSLAGASATARRLALFGAALAAIGIVQYAMLGNGEYEPIRIYGFWAPRYRALSFGPFINRNHFAGWMLMALPVAAGAAVGAWEASGLQSRGWRRHVEWLSTRAGAGALLMIFATVLMAAGLVLSESRSGMVGLAVGATTFAASVARHQRTGRARLLATVAFAAAALLVIGWAGADVIVRRVSSLSGDLAGIGGRREAWANSLDIVGHFPWTGTGLNTFGTAMMQYQTGGGALHFQEAHNDYLQLAAEGGVLVGLPVLAALIVFVRDVRRRFREAPRSGATYWLRVGAVCGLAAIGVQSIFEFSLQMPGNAVLFALVAAFALHRSPNLRTNLRPNLRPRTNLRADPGSDLHDPSA